MKKISVLLSLALVTLSISAIGASSGKMGDYIKVVNSAGISIGYSFGDPDTSSAVYYIHKGKSDSYQIKDGDGVEQIFAGVCKNGGTPPFNTCSDQDAIKNMHPCNGGTTYNVINVAKVSVTSLGSNKMAPSCTVTCQSGYSGNCN